MKRGLPFLWLSAAAWLLAGCAGYHLGPSNGMTAGARTIQIAPFVNQTIEPRLPDALMVSLRKNLTQNGTYRLDSQDEGDIIVTGEIISYDRQGVSVQPTDVLTVVDYEIHMIAHITARERGTGKVLYDGKVLGKTSLRAVPDLTSAERQAIPQMTDDLAKRATALLVDGTW